jgi:hypothetical protein
MRKLGAFLGVLACWAGLSIQANAQFYPNPGGTPIPPGMPAGPYMPGTYHSPVPMPPNPIERPNAWTEEEFNVVAPIRWHLGAEYVAFFTKDARLPPVLTRGSILDAAPGALGQPGTTTLLGGQDYFVGPISGFRATGTYWLADPELLAIDVNFMMSAVRRRQFTNTLDATGADVVARPFFNVPTASQAAFPVLIPAAGFGGPVSGFTTDAIEQQIMGSEVNVKANLTGGGYKSGHHVIVLAGTRWLFVHEAYENSDFTSAGAVSNITADVINTDNRFYGGQGGLQYRGRLDRFTVDLFGKIALGIMQQRLETTGTFTSTDAATGITTFATGSGNYVVGSNSGVFTRNRFTVVPEVGVNLGFDITDAIHVNLGYSMLFLSNVLRPGDQIDPNFNFNTLQQPVTLLRETAFWVGMLNVGFEWRF